jgi:hypothetical protein
MNSDESYFIKLKKDAEEYFEEYELSLSSSIRDNGLIYDMDINVSNSYLLETGVWASYKLFKPNVQVFFSGNATDLFSLDSTSSEAVSSSIDGGVYLNNKFWVKGKVKLEIGVRINNIYTGHIKNLRAQWLILIPQL